MCLSVSFHSANTTLLLYHSTVVLLLPSSQDQAFLVHTFLCPFRKDAILRNINSGDIKRQGKAVPSYHSLITSFEELQKRKKPHQFVEEPLAVMHPPTTLHPTLHRASQLAASSTFHSLAGTARNARFASKVSLRALFSAGAARSSYFTPAIPSALLRKVTSNGVASSSSPAQLSPTAFLHNSTEKSQSIAAKKGASLHPKLQGAAKEVSEYDYALPHPVWSDQEVNSVKISHRDTFNVS